MTAAQNSFPFLCKQWRRQRHVSQLQLAETAEISQRHLSWLETGRSQPSQAMVLKLAEALEIPLRERNTLLHAAGFAAQYRESDLSDAHMAPVSSALEQILLHHEPFPAIVVDRQWNRLAGNAAADKLFALTGAANTGKLANDEPLNLARETLRPDGLRRFISNWEEAVPLFAHRLRREAHASGDLATIAHIEALIRSADDLPKIAPPTQELLPVLPLELDIHGLHLSFFSVISTFGTPQDITTDELRIEAFYPSDDATRAFFQAAAEP